MILQYELSLASQSIRQIKDKAISEGTYINPRLPAWKDYCQAKEQASLLLTAIAILKYFGRIPEKKDLRKAIRLFPAQWPKGVQPFRAHCGNRGRGCRFCRRVTGAKDQSAFIFSAYWLLQLPHMLEANIKKVEEWAAQREAEAKARKEAQDAGMTVPELGLKL
jgi:hypothetical protein